MNIVQNCLAPPISPTSVYCRIHTDRIVSEPSSTLLDFFFSLSLPPGWGVGEGDVLPIYKYLRFLPTNIIKILRKTPASSVKYDAPCSLNYDVISARCNC